MYEKFRDILLTDLENCINCDAALIVASNICPQCGWPKDKPIKRVDEIETESDAEDSEIKFVKRVSRPAGVRLLGMSYVVFGIITVAASIIFGSFMGYMVISEAMSGLNLIGGVEMPIALPIGGIDSSTISTLSMMNEVSVMEVIGNSALTFANSTSMMDVSMMLDIIMGIFMVTTVGVVIGLIYFMFGRYLLRGNKWARYLVIIAAVISIPVFIPFVTEVDITLFAAAIINGLVLYYLFKPHVREYFGQTSIKSIKTKTKS